MQGSARTCSRWLPAPPATSGKWANPPMAKRTTRSPSTAANRTDHAPATSPHPDRRRSPTMQPRRSVPRITGAVAASLITAAAVAGVTTAGAPAAANPTASVTPCVAWTGGEQPPDPGGADENHTLRGVAVLSPCNAWAVGNYGSGQALITHWDGASWTAVPSPNPGTE